MLVLLLLLALPACSFHRSLKVTPDGSVECGREDKLSEELAKGLSASLQRVAALPNVSVAPRDGADEPAAEAQKALTEALAAVTQPSAAERDGVGAIVKAITNAKARIAEAEANGKMAEALAKVAEAKARIAEATARKGIVSEAVDACAKMFDG